MSEVLNIEELRKMAATVISIPNFDNTGTIKVRVQKPRLITMASQGKIPNHLLGIVNDMIVGKSSRKKQEGVKVKDITSMMELYCKACLIEPTYDEFKDIMTDEQIEAIFDWAMGGMSELDTFRDNKKDGTNNNNGKTLQEKV